MKTKKINNRTIIGIVCIVLALVVTFGVSPLVNRISDQKTDIVRVKNTIERGQQITANDLEIVRVGSYNLPDGVIKDGKSVVGKYATATLFAGDYLFSEKITGESNSAADILAALDGKKRVRKYGAFITGITQNVEDLLQSHTARTMLANSELVVMLNQAATDRAELADLMGISDLQMSYITGVEAGHGLVKIGSALVPFVNRVPKDTMLFKLMNTKPGEA